MSTVAKTSKKSTIRTTTAAKKAATKKAGAKPVAAKAKKQEAKANGNGKSAVTTLRETIIKSFPKVPDVDALMKSSGMPKGRVLMYRGAIIRTLTTVQKLGRLA